MENGINEYVINFKGKSSDDAIMVKAYLRYLWDSLYKMQPYKQTETKKLPKYRNKSKPESWAYPGWNRRI